MERTVRAGHLAKTSDILALFAATRKGDTVVITHVHELPRSLDEFIIGIHRDGVIDVVIGPEGDQKVMRMKLPEFTMRVETEEPGKVSVAIAREFMISRPQDITWTEFVSIAADIFEFDRGGSDPNEIQDWIDDNELVKDIAEEMESRQDAAIEQAEREIREEEEVK